MVALHTPRRGAIIQGTDSAGAGEVINAQVSTLMLLKL